MVSIGMVNIHAQKQPTTLLEHADLPLYYAKEHGRNKVDRQLNEWPCETLEFETPAERFKASVALTG